MTNVIIIIGHHALVDIARLQSNISADTNLSMFHLKHKETNCKGMYCSVDWSFYN